MGDLRVNTGYMQTQRGIIKILEIVLGFIVCCMICTSLFGGRSCFSDFRMSFTSALCFVATVINVVLFIMNFLSMGPANLERIYSLVAAVLFLIAAILILWFLIEMSSGRVLLIFTFILLILQLALYAFDFKILHGLAK
ncbi:unnamed protein product, partial [Mesorhabditis spiculigera]